VCVYHSVVYVLVGLFTVIFYFLFLYSVPSIFSILCVRNAHTSSSSFLRYTTTMYIGRVFFSVARIALINHLWPLSLVFLLVYYLVDGQDFLSLRWTHWSWSLEIPVHCTACTNIFLHSRQCARWPLYTIAVCLVMCLLYNVGNGKGGGRYSLGSQRRRPSVGGMLDDV
jgi:hypothetical protein